MPGGKKTLNNVVKKLHFSGKAHKTLTETGFGKAFTCMDAYRLGAYSLGPRNLGLRIWDFAMRSLARGPTAWGLQSRITDLGSCNVVTWMGAYSLGAYNLGLRI